MDVDGKCAARFALGLCIGCGHKPCTCKSKGKLRNRTNGVGTNESRQPLLSGKVSQGDKNAEDVRSR